MPARGRAVAVVAHCHLNANTKVHGLADYEGARRDVVDSLIQCGVGIVQLPCPEATYLGLARWGMTREQYDVASYRRHCQKLLEPIVEILLALKADGCTIEAVVGVDGSPSCGVSRTCVGYAGGEIAALSDTGIPQASEAPKPGVFIEVLQALMGDAGLDVEFRGVTEHLSG
ncbi:MAG: hypothetical protein U1E26_02355 [Coriobacteriia bacterium]|nr:hypothetical protein [Coriobacteriia bacterium]